MYSSKYIKEINEQIEKDEKSRRYGDRLLASCLSYWKECKDYERKDKWGGNRGHETIRHYFANLPEAERNMVAEQHWDENILTPKQLRILKEKFLKYDYYLIRENITMLEASMLMAWVEDFDNLDKKPLYDLEYAMPFPQDIEEEEIEKYVAENCMKKASSVYTPGIIALIEQFTLAYEELRLYVIYTYYNKEEQPLYIGCSKDFYNAHYFNQQRLTCADEIEYVGFFFLDNEDDMKDAKKYFIKARNPIYNQRRGKNVPLLPGLDLSCDEFVVLNSEMEKRWAEWLGTTKNDVFLNGTIMTNDKYEELFKNNGLWMELHLTDERYKFVKGFLHFDGQDVEMDAITYFVPELPDAMIVGSTDEVNMWKMNGSMCRYFLDDRVIEFFKKPGDEEDEVNYPVPMVIHNTCIRPLSICFEGMDATWTIPPGENKRIIPWRMDGADKIE